MEEQSKAPIQQSNPLIVESPFLVYFSIAMIALSGLVLSFFLYKASQTVTSLDPMPELMSLTPATIDQLGGSPGVVKVGLYIKDFTEFDMLANNFIFSGILWFLFDPSIVSLETLSKFSFEKGEIQFLSAPSTRIVGGKLLARYDIRVKMKTNLVYTLFPFESHTLYITLDNNFVTPGELAFESSNNEFAVSPDIRNAGWRLKDMRVNTGYSHAQLEKHPSENDVYHPRVVFALDYAHSGMRQALTILLPLILTFFMAIFSFTMDPKKNYAPVLAISMGAVTALLAYRFVIENLSPKVGYFLISDYLFFLFLMGTFVIFLINMGGLKVRETHKKLLIVLLHASIIVACVYILRVLKMGIL